MDDEGYVLQKKQPLSPPALEPLEELDGLNSCDINFSTRCCPKGSTHFKEIVIQNRHAINLPIRHVKALEKQK